MLGPILVLSLPLLFSSLLANRDCFLVRDNCATFLLASNQLLVNAISPEFQLLVRLELTRARNHLRVVIILFFVYCAFFDLLQLIVSVLADVSVAIAILGVFEIVDLA